MKINNKFARTISVLLALTMIFSVLMCAPFTANAASNGEYTYEVSNGYAQITGYSGKAKNLTIPNTINGYYVTSIGDSAFRGKNELESVKIPENVYLICRNAFMDCVNLKNISMPPMVVYVEKGAFDNIKYSNIESNWKNGILYIGKVAYRNRNQNAKSISFEHGTVAIAENCIDYGPNLTALTIPDTVIGIGQLAAYNCPKLKSVTVPYGAELIGNYALGFYESDYMYYEPYKDFKIVGAKGTLIEDYANYYGFKFVDGSKAKTLSINRTSLTLGVGEEYTLIKKVTPSSGANCTWKSSNNSVAEVCEHGCVTAKKAGTATITVKTSNGLSKSCKVTVKPAPSSIKVSTSNLSLGVGEEFIISESTNSGADAWKFSWSSSNSKVATVTKTSGNKAKIVAKGTGTANITVKTYNGKTAVCKVTVKPAPTSVSLTSSNITLGKGETFIIAQNSNSGSYAKNFTWSSSNTNVATVAKTSGNKAKITAKNNGTAYIKIKTYNGKTATCKVTVKNAPSSVKTNPKSVTLGVGETYTVSESTNSGTYANASNLSWSSSNSSVAVVTKGSGNKAVITAKRAGTANITIKLYNGKTASCKVTVKPAPSSVKVNPSNVNLQVGETYTVSEITNSGSYANASNLKWSSSDSSVATVTKGSGNKAVITAKKAGTAKITIRLYNGKTAVCTVTVSENEFSQQINRVVQLVNVQRAKVGLQPLTADKSLNSVALIRATEIVKNFSHTRPNGSYFHTAIDENNIHYGHAGENIAKGAVDADKVMELWMNSEGHRNNILSKNYNKIGVACYEYGGTYHWVQIFTD